MGAGFERADALPAEDASCIAPDELLAALPLSTTPGDRDFRSWAKELVMNQIYAYYIRFPPPLGTLRTEHGGR